MRSIFGPFVCGDAVDISGGIVLTGSWRAENQLELWDVASGKLVERIPWKHSALSGGESCQVYAAQFCKGRPDLIAAGGSGLNEAKVFDRTRGNKLVG